MVIFDMIYRDPSGRVVHIGRWDGTTEAPPADWVGEEGPVEILPDASRRVWSPEPTIDPPTEAGFSLPEALEQALAADNARGDVFSGEEDISEKQALEAALAQKAEELALANERIAELESREPEVRIERVEVAAVVEPDPPAAPYVPDFTLIPDALAKFAEADETAADFRNRLKRLWQRFGIADGENFPGGGEALTGEEKITMREIDIVLNSEDGVNGGLLEWMLADEKRT